MTDDTTIPYDTEQTNYDPTVPVGWFIEHTGDNIHPHVATNTEQWWVYDGPENPIACALVEVHDENRTPELHRIGVADHKRREGIASALVARLLKEYGELECIVREDNRDAQQFYEATGWDQTGVRTGDPDCFEYHAEYEPERHGAI